MEQANRTKLVAWILLILTLTLTLAQAVTPLLFESAKYDRQRMLLIALFGSWAVINYLIIRKSPKA